MAGFRAGRKVERRPEMSRSHPVAVARILIGVSLAIAVLKDTLL